MRVHFMGLAGSGASAVAQIARTNGFEVTGCDLSPKNEFTKDFASDQIFEGHSPDHLLKSEQVYQGFVGSSLPKNKKPIDILAISPAISSFDPNNSELLAAKEMGLEVLTWQEFMGQYLAKDKFVIAVCGTHGKSTTTAMVAQLLEDAKLDPTVELGAVIPKWGKNFRVGKGKMFVTEADEFNNNFLAINPDIGIVTNIEMDHPEFFKDFEDVKKSFLQFLYQVKGLIIANLADPGVREVLEKFQKNKDKKLNPKIIDYSKSEINFPLKVVGDFNKLNATAAFQVGLNLGIDPNIIRNSLMGYTGIGRRMEQVGEIKGALIFSDFGHHPTEIKITVNALKEKFKEKKLVLIFEPHMFSRTKALFNDFVEVFQNLPVDQTFITDIYPSREKDPGDLSSKDLVKTVGDSKTSYLEKEKVVEFIKILAKKDDIIIFMGAGDIDKLAREIVR